MADVEELLTRLRLAEAKAAVEAQQRAAAEAKAAAAEAKAAVEAQQRAAAEAKAIQAKQNNKSVVDYGLPPLPEHSSGTDTGASVNLGHMEAKAIESLQGFGIIDDIMAKLQRADTVTLCETDVARVVTEALEDIAAAIRPLLPPGVELTFQAELSVFGDRTDLWVLRVRGIPVGVVEVKKPGGSIMDNARAHGQLYDYMKRLRQFHGLDNVFGILTTYNEWRVFWLDDCSAAAAATTVDVPSSVAAVNAVEQLKPDIPTLGGNDTYHDQLCPPSPAKRIFRTAETWKYNDPDIIAKLASVLLKMALSPATKLTRLISPERQYIKVTANSWVWAETTGDFTLRLGAIPRSNAVNFLLLLHLGDGEYGRVWLAATTSGVACVLKFPKNTFANDFASEAAVWNDVWTEAKGARVVQIADKDALLMPYVKMCGRDAPSDERIRQATIAAVKHMANRGWVHNDLRWDHVGLYKTSQGEIKAVLIDLASSKPIQDKYSAEKAMLIKLGLAS